MQAEKHIRLSQLNDKIQQVVQQAFSSVSFWVIADVTSHTYRAAKNYHSFDLVEKDTHSNNIIAKISGKAWGMGSTSITRFEAITGQPFTNNIQVLVNISVQFHPVYGLQINLHDIDPSFTLGKLEQQRQATLQKLVDENPGFITKRGEVYDTRNKQLPLNKVIQRVAVITSATSAGGEDFRHTLANNPYGYQFYLDNFFTIVQGENNADLLVQKLIDIFQANQPYDAVVIIRGGGAQTDFLLFDNYQVGKAIAKFPVPVITGIGHQKNETIADMMAHTATKTPTQAAEFIISHNKQFEDTLLLLQKHIVIKSQQLFSLQWQQLAALQSGIVNNTRDAIADYKDSLTSLNQAVIHSSRSIVFNQKTELINLSSQLSALPRMILQDKKNELSNAIHHIKVFNTQLLKNQATHLGHYSSLIKLMSPDNILKKGFAIVKARQAVTSNPADILPGDSIEVILSSTEIQATVTSKAPYDGRDFNI
ncbi:Exodeoxyribonuclease VII large subunit [Filimonas lacunae]|uniref:Exodeoxyribonuclease 7 large subunit n=1 Tax=Filimonas lacunae TaxID=477680 RepID=A0A173MLP9_9BACT|nr:exodeoxyribonuclease VII large subunit [Filimonas lacunae]BAV08331.1 exodeoxyribonuclease VII large subunit [Filimonas lacunae]SIT33385.1 Exodeoxyribonuclease VII large subunit [Filimonas lacunae]